ncbi:hypothetical protein ACE6H2_001910 [Prunus campanulata]
MGKKDSCKSNRYSAINKITKPNSRDAGIEPSRISDVHRSSTAEGQGASGGTKLKGDGHNLGNININDNTITATKGESDVGMFIFHNINYNRKTTSTKDHGKAAGGSCSAQGQGGSGGKKPKGDGLNISRNNIKGDGVPKAYHNFSNFECNLKTTNTEDGGSTNQFTIFKNNITARNGSSNVGMFNFHNVNIDAAQAQGGFLKPEKLGIRHNIKGNTIEAVNSRKVGIQDFGNIKYNCGSFRSRLLDFLGL